MGGMILTGQNRSNCIRNKMSQYHFVHHKSHTRIGLELKPALCRRSRRLTVRAMAPPGFTVCLNKILYKNQTSPSVETYKLLITNGIRLTFVKEQRKVMHVYEGNVYIPSGQSRVQEIHRYNTLRNKLYLSNLKTQFVPRRKHSLPRL